MKLAIYRGTDIHADNGMVNMTNMWRASGGENHTRPQFFLNLESTRNLLKALEKSVKGRDPVLLKVKRGRAGGTYAHPQLAIAYAEYISPEFHAWATGVIKDRVEEDADPELGVNRSRERAKKIWRAGGWSEDQINTRLNGIDTRNLFTSMLSKHGVKGRGFGNATNGTYMAVMGGTADELRKDRGLTKKDNLRDHLDMVELATLQLAEAMSTTVIERENRQGNRDCCRAVVKTGALVAPALEGFKKL